MTCIYLVIIAYMIYCESCSSLTIDEYMDESVEVRYICNAHHHRVNIHILQLVI